MLSIDVTDEQHQLVFDPARLTRAAEAILRDAGIEQAQLSIAIVDDATIHALNRQFLAHDYPTDVLSFALEQGPGSLEGEVVASAETAVRSAADFGWEPQDELLLYVIHGALHLVGHDDATDEDRRAMRAAEGRYLALFSLPPRAAGAC
jgi:probable rRNA maturation factor